MMALCMISAATILAGLGAWMVLIFMCMSKEPEGEDNKHGGMR